MIHCSSKCNNQVTVLMEPVLVFGIDSCSVHVNWTKKFLTLGLYVKFGLYRISFYSGFSSDIFHCTGYIVNYFAKSINYSPSIFVTELCMHVMIFFEYIEWRKNLLIITGILWSMSWLPVNVPQFYGCCYWGKTILIFLTRGRVRGYGVWCYFQQYFSYIVAVSFIGGGNRGKKHWPAASSWKKLSHNVVSSTPHLSRIQTHNVSGDRLLIR